MIATVTITETAITVLTALVVATDHPALGMGLQAQAMERAMAQGRDTALLPLTTETATAQIMTATETDMTADSSTVPVMR